MPGPLAIALTVSYRKSLPSGSSLRRPRAVACAHRQGSAVFAGLQLRPGLTFGELVAKLGGQFVLLTFDRLVELLLKRWADSILFA